MRHSTKNAMKEKILETISNREWRTTRGVQTRLLNLGIKSRIRAVRMALMRYYRQGLVKRRKLLGNRYEYKISDRGIERLNWLMNQMRE